MGTVRDDTVRPVDRTDAYAALVRIGNRLHGASGDVDAALDLIVEQAQSLLEADLAWLVLAERGVLRPVVIRGFRSQAFLQAELPIGLGVGGTAIARQQPLIVDDYASFAHETTAQVRDTMLAEGAAAMVCAPMLRDGQLVGTLYVADRRPARFTTEDAWLLGALATQASVAIESRRLYRRITTQNELLEQSFSVHRRLMEASLDEAGLLGLAELLTELVGCPLTVEQEICEPYLHRTGADPRESADGPRVTFPIAGGGGRLGTILIHGVTALTPLQAKAVELGTTLLALELLKQQAAIEVGWRMSGELLEELLETPGAIPESLARRAARLNVDVDAPHRMLAIAPVQASGTSSGALLDIARGAIAKRSPGSGGQALAVKRGQEVLLALPPALERHASQIAEAIQESARKPVGPLRVGIGPADADLAASCRGAVGCLRLATNVADAEAVIHYDRLGSLRFLLDAKSVRHAAAVAREPLDPLIEHDRRSRTPLVETTRAFVECGGNYARASERCFIAVNTMRYRLKQVERVLGAHPSDPELAFRLALAFKILDLMDAIGAGDPA